MPSSSSSSSGLSTSTIIAILSTSALIYTQWSNLPAWLRTAPKKTTSSEGTRSGNDDAGGIDKDANDDLANPTAVLAKLTEMNDLLDKVMDETHAQTKATTTDTRSGDAVEKADKCMDQIDLLAAFYSLIHLYREFFAKDPDYRDKQYHSSSQDKNDDDVNVQDLHELAEYLEYAHWAYQVSDEILSKDCRKAGLDLISHDTATEPGRVGHFIALNHSSKLAIVGLKGTSTISDVLTDLIAIPKEHVGCHFDDEIFAAANKNKGEIVEGATESMRVHEGIFTAALWMADKLQPMIENLLIPLQYKVVLCGHSLGTCEYERERGKALIAWDFGLAFLGIFVRIIEMLKKLTFLFRSIHIPKARERPVCWGSN